MMFPKFEDQSIEWKRSWEDEYLKTVCGFANAQGGRLYIGVNDDGKAVGVILEKDTSVQRYEKKMADEEELKQLMEAIPDKVKNALNLTVDVNLLTNNGVYCIEINVPPSATPISYHGEYYYRSGSTTKTLSGIDLNQFLLSRSGSQWDAVPVPGISEEELDRESFEIFRRAAVRSNRMKREDLAMNDAELLDKLGLMVNGQLTRAAVLLFHHNPVSVSRGCCVRIAMFGEGADILYQDEVQGSLLFIADRVVDLIYFKYLKAAIHYDKETRIETYPYPREAIREIIFNALIHCNWSADNDIQVRMDANSIRISNSCILPMGWTVETLFAPHSSRPKNPSIAKTFQRAGYVEVWGRGIAKILESCRENDNPPPEFSLVGEELTVQLFASERARIVYPSHLPSFDEMIRKRILEEIVRGGTMKTDALAAKLQLPPATIRHALFALMGTGEVSVGETNASAGKLDGSGGLSRDKTSNTSKIDASHFNIEPIESQILSILKRNAFINQAEIAAELHYSPGAIQRVMSRMMRVGMIDYQRIGRKSHWAVLCGENVSGKVNPENRIDKTPILNSNDVLVNSILEQLKKNPSITQAALAGRLHLPIWRVQGMMSRMVQAGILVREGGKQRGVWKILN